MIYSMMSEELENESEAINSIYGADTLIQSDEPGVYILTISQHETSSGSPSLETIPRQYRMYLAPSQRAIIQERAMENIYPTVLEIPCIGFLPQARYASSIYCRSLILP